MALLVLVFDSHPVQYRVPVWQTMEQKSPNSIHVVYASDCSVKGHADEGFGKTFAWDEPMLEGYAHTVLNCEKGKPLVAWGSLTGKGVTSVFEKIKPNAVLLTGLNYKYDLVAYFAARRRGIPVWLRCETQDESVHRSKLKGVFRSLIYRIAYMGFDRIFYIGQLNKQHYLKHGVTLDRLIPAHYATVDRFIKLTDSEKNTLRQQARFKACIHETKFVVGFSGKLIPKKNPDILFAMLEYLPEQIRNNIHIYFLGSGELEDSLSIEAERIFKRYGIKTYFAGFVNQTEMPSHYLAMDIMVLPSRRMGETWGLVANEAMQSGCGVIVSDAVGSSADFNSWERFRVFKEGDAKDLAKAVTRLASYERSFDWAGEGMANYSIEAIATAILKTENI